MGSIEESLEKLDEILETYLKQSVGLPVVRSDVLQESDYYINLTRSQIENLGPEDCASGAYLLHCLSFHIQKTLNREIGIRDWSKLKIKRLVADKAHNYPGSWDRQELQALMESDVGRKLHQVFIECELRIDNLSYMANSINNIANSLSNIQRAKMGKKDG